MKRSTKLRMRILKHYLTAGVIGAIAALILLWLIWTPVSSGNETQTASKDLKKLMKKHGTLIAFENNGKLYFKNSKGVKCELK